MTLDTTLSETAADAAWIEDETAWRARRARAGRAVQLDLTRHSLCDTCRLYVRTATVSPWPADRSISEVIEPERMI